MELHITWDFGVIPTILGVKASACDLNTALVARITTEGNQQLIICRELLALIQYRNKIIAEFQQKMSRLKEGSRRWKVLLNAKLKVLKRLERRIDQQVNVLTKLMADLDQTEGIAFSVLGKLTGIRQKSRTGDKIKRPVKKLINCRMPKLNSSISTSPYSDRYVPIMKAKNIVPRHAVTVGQETNLTGSTGAFGVAKTAMQ